MNDVYMTDEVVKIIEEAVSKGKKLEIRRDHKKAKEGIKDILIFEVRTDKLNN